MISWLEKHLVPCPFKYLFGIDCPGCGFQRSCIALLSGDLHNSLVLYPATIPILITALFMLLSIKYQFNKTPVIKRLLITCTAAIIIISYTFKMWDVYQHHVVSIVAVR